MGTTKTALVDGDSFIYEAGFSVEKTKYLVQTSGYDFKEFDSAKEAKEYAGTGESAGVIWNRKELGTLEQAKLNLDYRINRAIERSGAGNQFVYISSTSPTFRDSVATIRKYKGNRDASGRPSYYSDLREHMVARWHAILCTGEEADDRISWVARQRHQHYGIDSTVVVGIDKDLWQIPGDHYDWKTDEIKNFSDDEARLWYWAQVLAGDSGDNVLGCWKLGIKSARAFLSQCNGLSDEAMWPKIVRKYRDSQKLPECPYATLDPEAVALEQARLVRLRHVVDEALWAPSVPPKVPEGTWTPDTKQEETRKLNGQEENRHESGESKSRGKAATAKSANSAEGSER